MTARRKKKPCKNHVVGYKVVTLDQTGVVQISRTFLVHDQPNAHLRADVHFHEETARLAKAGLPGRVVVNYVWGE